MRHQPEKQEVAFAFFHQEGQFAGQQIDEGEDEEELLGTSSVISGWELGMAVEMAIRNAVEEVGAENIDKEALRDGLFAIDVQLTGYINKWQSSKGCNNALQWKQRVFEYSVSEERWLPLEGIYEPVLTKPAC